MNWITDWKALYSRIQGLMDAGFFFYSAHEGSSSDDKSVKRKVLLKNAEKIFGELRAFMGNYESILPAAAYQSLERFLNNQDIQNIDFEPNQTQARGWVQFALTSLAAFCSEFSYLIADTQVIARRITDRAFIHLKRSIMVDPEIQKKWKDAFKDAGETECEKLGAIHLLSHGVWAFKVRGEGARTDLILNEPLTDSLSIENVADALVLTEWKVVRAGDKLNKKIKEAQRQTKLYSLGVLGGVELSNYRYLIMVTEEEVPMPNDFTEDTVTYRLVNIAVSPKTPSVEARKKMVLYSFLCEIKNV